MSIDGLPPLREVIAAHKLSAKKTLSQNFILDLNLTRRIARAAAPLDQGIIIEVGPGPGGLTRALLHEGAQKIIAIEKDERCIPALEEIAARYPGRLDIHLGDALEYDFAQFAPQKLQIIANLPYGIATLLLVNWLKFSPWPPPYHQLTLLFQKEVAERITAKPGEKHYGRLAIMSAWRSEAKMLFNLPPRAFTPAPKVASTLVQIRPNETPVYPCSVDMLEKITAAAFGQRRKMLRSSLKQLGPHMADLLAQLDIEPTLRAEQLDIKAFCQLAALYEEELG